MGPPPYPTSRSQWSVKGPSPRKGPCGMVQAERAEHRNDKKNIQKYELTCKTREFGSLTDGRTSLARGSELRFCFRTSPWNGEKIYLNSNNTYNLGKTALAKFRFFNQFTPFLTISTEDCIQDIFRFILFFIEIFLPVESSLKHLLLL